MDSVKTVTELSREIPVAGSADVIVVPVFEKDVYTVTFLMETDKEPLELLASEYEYGTPSDDIEAPEPSKEPDEQFYYHFTGWYPPRPPSIRCSSAGCR